MSHTNVKPVDDRKIDKQQSINEVFEQARRVTDDAWRKTGFVLRRVRVKKETAVPHPVEEAETCRTLP